MKYELHITFNPQAARTPVTFLKNCLDMSGKGLVICVPGAVQSVQPMFCISSEFERDERARLWRTKWEVRAGALGEITRLKLETAVRSGADVLYYEEHWNIPEPDENSNNPMEYKNLRLSKNIVSDQWYATFRTREPIRVGKTVIENSFNYHQESVLEDSNPGIDKGWEPLL